ncbi:MAG TPA: hypothetical protein VIN05_02840 [Roseovarius sp.]
MTYFDDPRLAQALLNDLRPGMRLTPLQSRPSKVTEAEIDHVIARTLAQNRQIDARAALPAIAHQDELTGLAGRNARREAAQNGTAGSSMFEGSQPSGVEDLTGRTPAYLLGKWPLRGAVAIVAIIAAALAPWAIPVILLLAAGLTVTLGVAMGSDGVANALARVFYWQNARDPDRAERFRARVDRVATVMDAALDRLPERWTTGLYMPDFSREALLQDMDADRPDPFDRIAAEARRV